MPTHFPVMFAHSSLAFALALLVVAPCTITQASIARRQMHHSNMRDGYNGSSALLQKQSGTSPECLVHTGGTCLVADCAPWRGATSCNFGRCFCQPGYCAGSDGVCHQQTYKIVLDNVRIRNLRYPMYYMSVSAWFDGLEVSTDGKTTASQFILRALPDGNFVLSSVAYPDYMIYTVMDVDEDHDHSSSHSSRHSSTVTYSPSVGHIDRFGEVSAPTMAMKLARAPDGKSIMMSSFDYPERYFSVSRFSWGVHSTRDDPGLGGYWEFDPPLPLQVEKFNGRRCSFDCGYSASWKTSLTSTVFLLTMWTLTVFKASMEH